MKTLFKSSVENGYPDPDSDATGLRENRKNDSKSLFIIQISVHI